MDTNSKAILKPDVFSYFHSIQSYHTKQSEVE